jgi:hypothetical protein
VVNSFEDNRIRQTAKGESAAPGSKSPFDSFFAARPQGWIGLSGLVESSESASVPVDARLFITIVFLSFVDEVTRRMKMVTHAHNSPTIDLFYLMANNWPMWPRIEKGALFSMGSELFWFSVPIRDTWVFRRPVSINTSSHRYELALNPKWPVFDSFAFVRMGLYEG